MGCGLAGKQANSSMMRLNNFPVPFAETLAELPVVSRWAVIPVMMTWLIAAEDETYSLPLGWKLSHTTFAMVRWMVGESKIASGGNAGLNTGSDRQSSDDTPELNEHTVERNSCVHKWVADLLTPSRAGRH